MLKNIINRIFSITLIFSMLFAETNVSTFAQIHENVKDISALEECLDVIDESASWDGVTTKSVFAGEGYKITYLLQEHWDGGYLADVIIENTGEEKIENWTLEFISKSEISCVWNAVLRNPKFGKTVVCNAGWNQDIAVGNSIRFGILGQESFKGFPEDYIMSGRIENINPKEYNFDYVITSDWNSGFTAEYKITNNSENPLVDWIVEFDYDKEIDEIWNGTILSHENEHYVIKNSDYNSIIKSGESISIGWLCHSVCNEILPVNCVLSSYNGEYFDDNTDCSVVSGNKTIENGEETVNEDSTVSGNNAENGGNTVSGNTFDNADNNGNNNVNDEKTDNIVSGNTSECDENTESNSVSGNNMEIDGGTDENTENTETIEFDKDTDRDGVPDFVEDYFGSDKNIQDTDDDGLSDYYEIYGSLELNPVNKDSDDNGIEDGEEDSDEDGLINRLEHKIGTDIFSVDTDFDGLTDKEEYVVYKTNPCVPDTDGDGVFDGTEVVQNTSPRAYGYIFNVTVQSKEIDTVKASVNVLLSGSQVETLSVSRYNNDFFFPEDMPGYLGGAYDFKVSGSFRSATISFEFDSELLSDPMFVPVIYYFNEVEQVLEPLKTSLEGNVASAKVDHFSKYILLNKTAYFDSLVLRDVWEESDYSGIDVVFLINSSYTVGVTDPYNERIAVASGLIDSLPGNSRVALASYNSYVNKIIDQLTYDRDKVKKYLYFASFSSWAGTPYTESAILDIYSYFDNSDDSRYKMIVLLSDDSWQNFRNPYYLTVMDEAQKKDIKIYSVGFGEIEDNDFTRMKEFAQYTGGSFCMISDEEKLENLFSNLKRRIDVTTDTDNDGIPDYYEDNLVMFNGMSLKTDKNNPDSDNDGLSDGQEVTGLSIKYYEHDSKVRISGEILTNPLDEDSDHDGITDEEELLMGTDPSKGDTDEDGLNDGTEEVEGFDPFNADVDGDGRTDFIEYCDGTSPYLYDDNWRDYLNKFLYGAVCGDFIDETDSVAIVCGQILGSCVPLIDIRDVVGNLYNEHYGMAGLSAIGLLPDIGDATKAVGKTGRFIASNIDNIPKVVDVLGFTDKYLPEIAVAIGKSDEFVDVVRNISKADNLRLTKKEAQLIIKTAEKAGKADFVPKISNRLDIKYVIKMSYDAWNDTPLNRGRYIDELINQHEIGKGLGKNFPVVDRLLDEERLLVSTKSLNTLANSYQNPNKLEKVLNQYAESLKECEDKLFKDGDIFVRGGRELKRTDYDKKVLEIVLPDEIISEKNIAVFNKFKEDVAKTGMEVWYVIAK